MKKKLITLLAITSFLLPTQSCFAANIFENINAALTKITHDIQSTQKGNTGNQNSVPVATTQVKGTIHIPVSPDSGNATMNQLLIKGIQMKDISMVKTALENGANVNIYNNGNRNGTPLTLSFNNNNEEITDYLIAAGADVNAQVQILGCVSESKNSPLTIAIYNNDISLLQKLVQNGANINFADDFNSRPLDRAISFGSIPIIKYFIDNGAQVNYTEKFFHRTPLLDAVKDNKTEIVYMLLDAGANAKQADSKGQTALNYAIINGNKELINLFLSIGK